MTSFNSIIPMPAIKLRIIKPCLFALILCCCMGWASATDSVVSVEVHGEGASHWEARADCIRQALQQTMKQLVIADRRVEDDRLLKDSVLSTMNGYIDSFEILSESRQNGVVTITARVGVSATRIENFLAGNKLGTVNVDGAALTADFQRNRLARQARTEILARLFAGFPSSAFDVKVKHIEPGTQQDIAIVQVEVRASKEYIRSLKNGLEVLRKSGPSDDRQAWKVCFRDASQVEMVGGGAFVGRLSCIGVTDINLQTSLCPSLMQCFYQNGVLAFAYRFSGSRTSKVEFSQADGDLLGGIRLANHVVGPAYFRDLIHWEPNYSHSFVIDEAPHSFHFSIPLSSVPETSAELRVVPLFLVKQSSQLIRDLTEAGTVPVGSEEFQHVVSESLNF